MRITYIGGDSMLCRKLALALKEVAEVVNVHRDTSGVHDIILFDARGGEEYPDGCVPIVRRGCGGTEKALPYPFTFGELREVLRLNSRASAKRLTLSKDERCAYLDGKKIRLTEVEYKLLGEILGGAGEFVSREALIEGVWGIDADGGVLNVYIHYLREKLEVGGEKIIISSRKSGYKIDEKYTGGRSTC